MRRSGIIITFVLAVGLLPAPRAVAADQPAEAVKPPAGMNLFSPAQQRAADQQLLNTARQMIQAGNYEGAAGLLESIYGREPDNQVVLNLLRTCYDQMGQPAKSELLVRRMIELSPSSHLLHIFLAESLFRQADTAGALAEYDLALELVRDRNADLYGQVVRSMHTIGLSDRALALIQRLRSELANPALYAKEAGEIYESRREFLRAVEEYYIAMADTSRTGIEAENKLFLLLEFEESAPAVIKALEAHTSDATAARAAGILAGYYLKQGDMDRAMKYTLIRDSLGGTNGSALLTFMRTCSERQLYRQATVVGAEIAARYGSSPFLAESRFLLADALSHLGRLPEAIAVYDTIIATFPRIQDKSDAAYRIGMIYLNLMNDPGRALVMFDSVHAAYAGGLGYLRAMLAAPDAYVRLGDLEGARQSLQNLGRRQINEDVAEEMAFKLAKIDFYDRKFDSAVAAFQRLLVQYPRGFYVNDALQLLLVVEEAGVSNPLLHQYSDALLFAEQRQFDSSQASLEQITRAEDSSLADVALYRLADMSLSLLDSASALDHIDRLVKRFPGSYYTPFGLKMKGDMYTADPARLEEGKEIYRTLLTEHPNYPFISDVRKRLRELEWDPRTG